MAKDFWGNKNILITGYEGFLGSHLTKALLELKANVFGLDILTHRKHTILNKEFHRINIIRGDVENYPLMRGIIRKNNIECVFHLAAQSLVGCALSNPVKTFSTNILGTWNILESCRNSRTVKTIIIASSDKAYGIKNKLPYKEDFPLEGCHPYDVSKSCADLLAHTYFHTYGLPVCVTRCGNIFGPGDFNFSRIIPDIIRSAVKDKTLSIRSDGRFTRDYIYIMDVISGYLILAEKFQKLKLGGGAFNFSNEKPISVLNLVKIIYKVFGKKPSYRILNQARYEIKNQYLSAGKAKRTLGWKPKYTLGEGLAKTVNWYEDFFNSR